MLARRPQSPLLRTGAHSDTIGSFQVENVNSPVVADVMLTQHDSDHAVARAPQNTLRHDDPQLGVCSMSADVTLHRTVAISRSLHARSSTDFKQHADKFILLSLTIAKLVRPDQATRCARLNVSEPISAVGGRRKWPTRSCLFYISFRVIRCLSVDQLLIEDDHNWGARR